MVKDNKERRFKTKREAAEICGVHMRTIDNWVIQKKLTIYKLPNGRIRLDVKELIKKEEK